MLTDKEIVKVAAEMIDKAIVIAYYTDVEIILPVQTFKYEPSNAIVIVKGDNNYQFIDH